MSGLAEEKLRAREQWSQDPCGSHYDREHEFGTREFFDSVEQHRYSEYAPWMPEVMGFNEFPGARLLEIGCGMGTDLLQFLDGSSLHGKLRAVDVERGIQWQHPGAKQLIEFTPTNIASIGFENTQPVTVAAQQTCRFRFNNGDEVLGNLTAMDAENLELETWFGGKLKAPRASVQSVVFFSRGYSTLYEGPTGLDGWTLGKGPNNWRYRDGAFVTKGIGTLGRDFKLRRSASIEFDLGWAGPFNLMMVLYTDVLDRFDYTGSGYLFYLGPGYFNAQRVQPGAGTIMLNQAQLPGMLRKDKMRFEIRVNKVDGSFALLGDGAVIQRWKDSGGFMAKGSGILLSAQMDGSTIRLGNLKVSEWDGRFEADNVVEAPGKEDVVCLVNHDKVSGMLHGLRDGKLAVAAAQTKLDIPIQRVTQIVFGAGSTNAVARGSWEIRAVFSGGGSVSFQLGKWTEQQLSGTNPNFGSVLLDPRSIRQLQFNLDRKRVTAEEAGVDRESTWDLDESP